MYSDMYKSCSKCGKIHDANYNCTFGKVYRGGEERNLRKSNAWKRKSEEIREKANFLCEVCRDRGSYTYDGLEVHHIIKIKDNKELLLDNRNLICLCQEHHKMADRNALDADYLRRLALKREEN